MQESVLTRIYRQNHIRVVFISEETFPDEVLHLCDSSASLKIWSQKGSPASVSRGSHH